MKRFFLNILFLFCGFLSAQNSILQPPESVKLAFEKQFTNQKPIWSMELGSNVDDIKFVANFTQYPKLKAVAVYDSKGIFKSYKVPASMEKLPAVTKKYLTKEYQNTAKQVFIVVDDKKVETYEVLAVKDKKKYRMVFEKNGDFRNKTEIE